MGVWQLSPPVRRKLVPWKSEFEQWWDSLSVSEQAKVDARVRLLIDHGPNLGFPFSTQIKTSRFPEMRELRTQSAGDPIRVLYAFDPRRTAILLMAGNKTGDAKRMYQSPIRLFELHLKNLEKERAKHG